MMDLKVDVLQRVAADALKTVKGSKRWENAINKAVEQLLENPYISELNGLLLIASDSGAIYNTGVTCECQAYQRGQPCWHRAAWRIIQRYNEANAKSSYERAAELRAQRIMAALAPPPSMDIPMPSKTLTLSRITPALSTERAAAQVAIDELF